MLNEIQPRAWRVMTGLIAVGLFGLLFLAISASSQAANDPESQSVGAAVSSQTVTATIRFAQPSYALSAGETITVDLMMDNADDLSAWETTLVFDPDLMAVAGIDAGGFLSSQGRSEEILGPYVLGPGSVAIGGYAFGPGDVVSGTGLLAGVSFTALSEGQTSVDFNETLVLSHSIGIVNSLPVTGTGSLFNITAPQTMAFMAGWNLRALPVELNPPLTAQAWLDQLTAPGQNCSEIDRWLNGGWDPHVNGLPFNNFSIEMGHGYFLKCESPTDWTYNGDVPVAGIPIVFQPGWNLISIPYPPGVYEAQPLLDAINTQGGTCDEIDRWLNGGWDPHMDGLPFNDFAIEPNQGYFVRCTQDSTFAP